MNDNKNLNKKIIIICVTALLITALIMAATILLIKNNNTDNQTAAGIDKPAIGQGVTSSLMEPMTYEEFTRDLRDDLTDEETEKVKLLYDEICIAIENKDEEAVMAVYKALIDMDVLDNSKRDNVVVIGPEEMAELNEGGGDVYIVEDGAVVSLDDLVTEGSTDDN